MHERNNEDDRLEFQRRGVTRRDGSYVSILSPKGKPDDRGRPVENAILTASSRSAYSDLKT